MLILDQRHIFCVGAPIDKRIVQLDFSLFL
jgi:hypothetical protein